MANAYNAKLPNVETAFDNVPTDGVNHKFSGDPHVADMAESHVQGIAAYGDFFLLTHNNKGYSRGMILIIDRDSKKLVQNFPTSDDNYNHPGGCQVIGDFVAVSLENSSHDKSFIRFYDLSEMTDATQPALLDLEIVRPNNGAGGVGITNVTDVVNGEQIERYVLLTYDNGTIDIYRSNALPLGNADCQFEIVQSDFLIKETGYAEICLVTDTDNNIFMVGFRTDNLGGSNDDYADLYTVSLDPPGISDAIVQSHKKTQYGGVKGMDGVHFRWGAGLQIRADGQIELFATQRNFVGNLWYANTFDNQ